MNPSTWKRCYLLTALNMLTTVAAAQTPDVFIRMDVNPTYRVDDRGGSAHWEAWYTFSATGRKVHNVVEANFEFADGRVLRPDRVMLKDNSAILVDYKTGGENELHKTQLKDYSESLLNTGINKVESYLYYINRMKLVKV